MQIKKAILTGGGRATRLHPITAILNKHLLPLANKPMIFHAIEKIANAGISEIGININPGEIEIRQVVGNGSRWGVQITFIEQQGGPLGVAHIVKNAQSFLGEDDFVFYLGDNIILGSINSFVDKFRNERPNCMLALSKVRDPQRFGVPEMCDGRIVRVDEKPQAPKSNFAVTGIYIYDRNYFKAFEHIVPSGRGEYEISDIHTWLIQNGFNVGYQEITGWWKDTGKSEDLLEGNQLLLAEMTREEAVVEGEVDPEAIVHGRVKIGQGTVIKGRCLIRGPVTIGENCVIENSYIGPYTSLGNGVRVIGSEIEHSVVFDNVNIHCSKRVVDALIGKNVELASAAANMPVGHRLVIGDNSRVEL
ncbi:TPA: glucose-1-phosphate thymidylyltransferase [Candidatus Uhrbacteria bacterium]|nr:glucose-1-phosphate thymidylyltransferase [Candidatus Uhrbacteria bacterium]